MNEYDSDKMADVLARVRRPDAHRPRPRTPTSSCSTRARCARRRRSACSTTWAACARSRREQPDLMIGVGGCVASQEGAAIVQPRALRRRRVRPADAASAAAADRARGAAPAARRSTSSFPEIEKFDHLPPPRVEGASAFVSIMEGCSKYCTFCVVPYTRGEEVSRPFDDVLTEIADLADQGVMEITLLGQNVNAYRGPMGDGSEIADFATLLEYVAEIPGIERIRYTTSHPKEMTPRLIAAHGAIDKLVAAAAPAGAVGLGPRARRDEARLHGARVQVDRPPAARRAPGPVAHVRLHRRLPGRDRRRFRADDEARRGRRLRRRVQLPLQPASRNARRPSCRPGAAGGRAGAPRTAAGAARGAVPASQRRDGRHRQRVLVTGRAARTPASSPPAPTTTASSTSPAMPYSSALTSTCSSPPRIRIRCAASSP